MIPLDQLRRMQIKTSEDGTSTPEWQDVQFGQIELGDIFRYVDAEGNAISENGQVEFVAAGSPSLRVSFKATAGTEVSEAASET